MKLFSKLIPSVVIALPALALVMSVQDVGAADCVDVPADAGAWWKMEGDGLDALGDNDGSLQRGVTAGPGAVGQGLYFDGVDDRMRVAASSDLDVGAGGGVTVELWVRPDSVTLDQQLLQWNTGAGEVAFSIWLAFGGTQLHVNMGTANGHISTQGVLADGEWQHVAFTYDKAGGFGRLYHNGVEVENRLMGVGHRPQTTANLFLGVRPTGSGGAEPYAYAGGMDEVGVYSRALSAAELAAIYGAMDAGKCGGDLPPGQAVCVPLPESAVAWWKLEGDPADALGGSGGTISGGVVTVAGQVGNALEFNGLDSGVQVPASPALDVGAGDGLTLEMWVNPDSVTLNSPLLGWNTGSGEPSFFFWLSFGGTELFVNMGVRNGSMLTEGVLVPGEWQHVAFTYDGANGFGRLYHNGVEVERRMMGVGLRPVTTADLLMGVWPGGLRYAGGMDEVGLYSRALERGELAAIFHAGVEGKCDLTPNECAVALSGQVSTRAGSAIDVTLMGVDADGDALVYVVVAGPEHGTLSGVAPNLIYNPIPGFCGLDQFSFVVSDGDMDCPLSEGVVVIEVECPNQCPVAMAKLVGASWFDKTSQTHVVVGDGVEGALVAFDGSGSVDPDGDPLDLGWYEVIPGTVSGSSELVEIGRGALVEVGLTWGAHRILLVVDDGECVVESALDIEVVTVDDGLGIGVSLIEESDLSRREKHSLSKLLTKSLKALEHGKTEKAVRLLTDLVEALELELEGPNGALAESLLELLNPVLETLQREA